MLSIAQLRLSEQSLNPLPRHEEETDAGTKGRGYRLRRTRHTEHTSIPVLHRDGPGRYPDEEFQ